VKPDSRFRGNDIFFLVLVLLSFSIPVFSADTSTATDASETETVGPTTDPADFPEEYDIETREESAPVKKGISPTTPMSQEATMYDFEEAKKAAVEKELEGLGAGSLMKMSGQYRLAAGVSDEHQFFVNDANADLQERNFRYLFGERLNNTYDPAVYSKYLLNVDFTPLDKISFYTQVVADPWSYVGTTGDQVANCAICPDTVELRYNLKYFGAFNSTINEIYRTHYTDAIAFPLIKVDGHHLTGGTVVHGFFDYNPATGGLPFNIPEHEINYEFRPFRKLWMDYNEDQWHVRLFAFADQTQALTTDDPLELSNHKDYWQQSPWLYQYKPVIFFADTSSPTGGSIQRGYYDDTLSFLARDSEGNRLVLLRGLSYEGDFGKTYLAATIASPYTPWDEDIYSTLFSDNVPGAIRLKHQVNEKLMVGSTYTFRTGLIDDSVADWNQVLGFDMKYPLNKHTNFRGEVAGGYREREIMTSEPIRANLEGYAFKAIIDSKFDHKLGHTDFEFRFTSMEPGFDPNLSRYTNTRDDHFWGNHLTFQEFPPNLEHFRIGDGVDRGRYVFHFRWKEKLFKQKFFNMFDVRNVHRTANDTYLETVLRDEITWKVTPQLTVKGLFRWQGLPESKTDLEPFLSNFYFYGFTDPSDIVLKNFDIPAGEDPSRFTYSAAAQYIFSKRWTAEAFVEVTNDVPDFPRGLLNSAFRDRNDYIDDIHIDHITTFLYGQGHLGAIPPYEYFTITRQRIIWKPDNKVTVTFHAAQNGYKYAAGIDDNINHQGVSVALALSKNVNFFMDFTHSMQIDVPKLIATGFQEHDFRDHYNFYASLDMKPHPSQILRLEYGVFGFGTGVNSPLVSPYATTGFSLPTIDTEHLFRVSLTGDF